MGTIILDCDGVLCDFIGGVCASVGGDVRPQDFTSFHLSSALNKEQYNWAMSAIGSQFWCQNLKPYFGARRFYGELLETGHKVVIATAPWKGSKYWIPERLAWLKEHIGVPEDDVVFISGPHKRLLQGEFLIEDNYDTAKRWAETIQGSEYVLKRPWNCSFDTGDLHFSDDYEDIVNDIVDHWCTP